VYIDVDVRSYCCQIGCSSAVDAGLLKAMYRITSIGLFSHVHVVCTFATSYFPSGRLCVSNPYHL